MADSEYRSVERVLCLLLYLMNSKEGATREEIFRDVPVYQDAPSESAQRRMFERDIRQIEQVGFDVMRDRRGRNPSVYHVSV